MQVPLLLVLLFVFASSQTTYTIDCAAAPIIDLTFTLGCTTTYQVINGTAGQANQAWQAWNQYCLGGPVSSLVDGDIIQFKGTCLADATTAINFATAGFNGTITFQSATAGTNAVLSFVANTYFIRTTNPDATSQANFVFNNLNFTTGGTFRNNLYGAQISDGNFVFNNVNLNGFLVQNSFILTQNTFTAGSRSIVWNGGDITGTFPGGNSNFDSLVHIQGGSKWSPVNLNNLNIHDTNFAGLLNVGSSYDVAGETVDYILSGVTISNVASDTGLGVLLNTNYNAEFGDFNLTIQDVSVSDVVFSSETYGAVIGWTPDPNLNIDGTFVLKNLKVASSTLAQLSGFILNIWGRSSVDISELSISGVTVTGVSGNGIVNLPTNVPSQGALFLDNIDGATLTDSNFTGNTGFVWGQLVTGYNAVNTVVSNVNFESNIGTSQKPWLSRGGAAHLLGSTSFNNVLFDLNSAEIGGAVYINNCDAYFTNALFTNNTAAVSRNYPFTTGAGGAVLKNLEGAVFFDTCNFEGNKATHGGGALAFVQDERLDTDVTNHRNGGDLFVSNSVFTENSAEYGGALYWLARDMIVQDTNFTQNTAQTGGAITAKDVNPFVSSPILFTNARFEDNVATGGVVQGLELQDGGALSSERNVQVNKALFAGNSAAAGNGGAITAYKGLTASYTLFETNTASGVGGAIWSNPNQPQPLSLFRSDFESNTAGGDGGAVWTNNPQTSFDGASFTNNVAGGFGGAAYLATQATVTGSGFVTNNATSGGAIYSIGDAVISGSRFDSNVAQNDGGAIDCISVPLGAVDFTLQTANNFFVNNQAVTGVGAHVHTTCTATDSGSTFTLAQVNAALNQSSYECLGNNRILRACELAFTNSKFISDSLAVWAPTTVTLAPLSSGLVLTTVTGNDFTLYSQAETTTITGSTFDKYTFTYENTRTTSSNNKFTGGDEECLSGPFSFDTNSYSSATVNIFDQATFVNCQFDGSVLDSNSAISLTDVTVTDDSHFDLSGPAVLKRVTVDASSSTVTESSVQASDVVVGGYTQLTGSLNLTGSFTCGGAGLSVEIAVDVSGSGDFTFLDGDFLNSAGSWSGSGALNLSSGSATFKVVGGGQVARSTEAGASVTVEGVAGLSLAATFNARGLFTLADDATITGTSDGSLNLYENVTFGIDNQIGVNTVAYASAFWAIVDKSTFSSVTFEGSATFDWPTNSTWTAHDARQFQYWSVDYGNGTSIDTDYGASYAIIVLTAPLDTTKYQCHSPVETVVYLYDSQNAQGEVVVETYPTEGGFAPAYVTCNNAQNQGPQQTLTLYSSASVMKPFGLLLVLVLALLF